MLTALFLVVLLIVSAYVFYTGRHVLGLLLLIGFTQDMVRKLTPGEPIYFIITVGIVVAAALLGLWSRGGLYRSYEPFLRWNNRLRAPLIAFLSVLALQFAYSLLQYGNLIVALIGLTTYLAPFLAVILGYSLVNSLDDVRDFFRAYCAVGVIVAMSVVASFLGYDWAVLKEVGEGLKIYDQGTILVAHAGIMRSGEVAAWHISSTACLIVALALTARKNPRFLLVIMLVALLMVAVALTGRRKMLMLTSLFLLVLLTTLLHYRKTLDTRYFVSVLLVIGVGWFGFEILSFDNYNESLRNYLARSSSVFTDATGRFIDMGITPIQWAYNRVGLFGGGLGIASQGSYLFNIQNVAGGSGEGGLGKIMVELGLPGLLCIIWLVFNLARHVDRSLQLSSQPFVERHVLPLMCSIAVLLAVNAITFSVATQVYGDIFILVLLGLLGGFLFALPKVVAKSLRGQSTSPSRMSHSMNRTGAGPKISLESGS